MRAYTDTSVLIVAKHADTTIGRAMLSAIGAGCGPIILVDSSANDLTSAAAIQAVPKGHPLHIEKLPESTPIGTARQRALDLTETPYAIWLDADDAILPGHIARYRKALEAGYDFVLSGAITTRLPDYSELSRSKVLRPFFTPGAEVWCFERNWMPSLHAGLRVKKALQVGFNKTLKGSEDHDFHLRAISQGLKMTALPGASYLYTDTPGSLSRDLNARAIDGMATARYWLGRDDLYPSIQRVLGAGPADWISAVLASMLRDWDRLDAVWDAATVARNGQVNLHPFYLEGIGTLINFLRATTNELRGRDDTTVLIDALDRPWNPAVFNNAAVSLARQGGPKNKKKALALLDKALEQLPHYRDALSNKDIILNDREQTLFLTMLPIRPHVSRDRY